MAEVSFPLDSDIIGYDGGLPVYSEQYGSKGLRDVFRRFFSNGVFKDDMLKVVKTSNNPAGEDSIISIKIQPGAAMINGLIYTNDDDITMTKTVPLATSSQTTVTKKYHVVLGLKEATTTNEQFYRELKETYDNTAFDDLTRNSSTYEIALATVTAKAVYSNGQSKCTVTIQDKRLDSEYCGLATPFREFDSSAFEGQLDSMIGELQRQTDIAVEVSQNAIDQTTAGELTQKIEGKLDDSDGSVKSNNIADDSIDNSKLAEDLKSRASYGVAQGGKVTVAIDSETNIGTLAVTFPKRFAKIASVTVSTLTGFPDSRLASVTSVTDTGFIAKVKVNVSNVTTVDVYWIAVGTPE